MFDAEAATVVPLPQSKAKVSGSDPLSTAAAVRVTTPPSFGAAFDVVNDVMRGASLAPSTTVKFAVDVLVAAPSLTVTVTV